MPKGWLFRHRSDPTFVYRDGSGVVAGVWENGPDVVVRSGTTENAPVVGRVIPRWNHEELALPSPSAWTWDPNSDRAIFRRESSETPRVCGSSTACIRATHV